MREMRNNWNSLEFAFQHLIVNKEEQTKSESNGLKNENNNFGKRKATVSISSDTGDPNQIHKEKHSDVKTEPEFEEDGTHPNRRSPRIRQNSTRTDSGRSTPIKTDNNIKMENDETRHQSRKRKGKDDKEERKSSEVITIVPKRESLRRVLELSKLEFTKPKDDESDLSGSDDDDEFLEKDYENTSLPFSNLETVSNDKVEEERVPNITSTTEIEVPKRKQTKTDPRILARQRELYHARKQRKKSNDNTDENSTEIKARKRKAAKEKSSAKPWSKVTERKTAPHILQRRKEQYYARKRIAAENPENPMTRNEGKTRIEGTPKKKTFKKIEAKKDLMMSHSSIAITPNPNPNTTSYGICTIIPPVVNASQLATLKSMDQLNYNSPSTTLLFRTNTTPAATIIKSTVIENSVQDSKTIINPPKKRQWGLDNKVRVQNMPNDIGSTNGILPKETNSNSNSNLSNGVKNGPALGNFKKKIAANWERSLSVSSESDESSKKCPAESKEKVESDGLILMDTPATPPIINEISTA
jgi:hypothetical protein